MLYDTILVGLRADVSLIKGFIYGPNLMLHARNNLVG